MPKQLDLQPQSPVIPNSTLSEPRLWVRRLAVWKKPETDPIRDISFRPGLNIIWSPGSGEASDKDIPEDAIGHGSGKTLLCRLIRYCLGERRFAPEDQRAGISRAFEEGCVGAEIMLDGVCWAVLRPLAHKQRHVAIAGGDLDAMAAGEGTHTSIDPFIEAVERTFFTPASIALVPGEQAWLTELAWLSRDQECRFDGVLEWRSAASGSESPARSLITDEVRLIALRVFLSAITPEERALSDDIRRMEGERERAKLEIAHRQWEAEQKKKRLGTEFGLKNDELNGELAVAALKRAARKRLAEVAQISPDSSLIDPEPLRASLDVAQQKLTEITSRQIEITTRIDEKEQIVSRMEKEVVGLRLSTDEEENPACPICEVPIDRVLAEQCKLSHKLVDLESIKERRKKHQEELQCQQKSLAGYRDDHIKIKSESQEAQAQVNDLRTRIAAIQKARDEHQDNWYSARRLVDDASRYEQLLQVLITSATSLESHIEQLDKKRGEMSLFRERQKQLFTKISSIFDNIIRSLIGTTASGSVRLTGNGLEPKVNMGGERRTAAIETLKVLAFDLTTLCLSVEKDSQIAPLLIHDSPREADLDIVLYHRLFHFVKELEDHLCHQGKPLFQYIVTTTTRPPDDLISTPWLREELHGGPATERLLRCDLQE